MMKIVPEVFDSVLPYVQNWIAELTLEFQLDELLRHFYSGHQILQSHQGSLIGKQLTDEQKSVLELEVRKHLVDPGDRRRDFPKYIRLLDMIKRLTHNDLTLIRLEVSKVIPQLPLDKLLFCIQFGLIDRDQFYNTYLKLSSSILVEHQIFQYCAEFWKFTDEEIKEIHISILFEFLLKREGPGVVSAMLDSLISMKYCSDNLAALFQCDDIPGINNETLLWKCFKLLQFHPKTDSKASVKFLEKRLDKINFGLDKEALKNIVKKVGKDLIGKNILAVIGLAHPVPFDDVDEQANLSVPANRIRDLGIRLRLIHEINLSNPELDKRIKVKITNLIQGYGLNEANDDPDYLIAQLKFQIEFPQYAPKDKAILESFKCRIEELKSRFTPEEYEKACDKYHRYKAALEGKNGKKRKLAGASFVDQPSRKKIKREPYSVD